MSEHIEFARSLRREQTDVEAKLWGYLRGRGFHGLKFRRQAPLGRYVVDFLCEAEKLVVEVDGWQHGEQLDYDEMRTRRIEEMGYRVIRLGSSDVRYRLADVLAELEANVGESHLPSSALRAPSPQGEGRT